MKHKIYYFAIIIILLCACTKKSSKKEVWVEGFRLESSMKGKRTGAAGIAINGYIYVFGGVDGNDFLQTTERAKINPDGTLGEWIELEPMNIKRGFFYAVYDNGFIYAIGGGNGPNGQHLLRSVERTTINPDGTIQPWIVEPHVMMSVRRCSKTKLINGVIYAVGGYNGRFVEYIDRTTINPDGSLGEWALDDNPTTEGRYIHGLTKKDNRIYVIAGHDEKTGVGLDDVEWTTVKPDGTLDVWQKDKSKLLWNRYGHSALTKNDFIYAIGGVDGRSYMSSIEFARVRPDGGLDEWEFTTPLTINRESTAALIYNNNLYVIGGSNFKGFESSVEMATFKEDGVLGYWVDKEKAGNLIKEKKGIMFKNSLILSGNVNQYFNQGNYYLKSKKYDMAETSYQKAIAIDPDFIDAYQNLSSVYLRLERFDEALEILDMTITKKHDYHYAYYNKACIYAIQNKIDLAISTLLQAIEFGYNDLKSIETDPDLNNIRNTPGYRKVIRKVIMKG